MFLAQLDEVVRHCAQCVIDEYPQTREFMIAGSLEVVADAVDLPDQIDQDVVGKNVSHCRRSFCLLLSYEVVDRAGDLVRQKSRPHWRGRPRSQ
jgi:hypothetical protein